VNTGASSSGRAFTLVECLAVVALLALVVATLAAGLAPSAAETRLRDARSAVLDLDARARVLATRGEPVVLRIAEGRASLWVGSSPALEREVAVGIALLEPGTRAPLEAVRINTRGRGPDYVLVIASGETHFETLVSGLTGYAFEERIP